MRDRRKALHDLIEEARDEDLPLLSELVARFQRPLDFPLQLVSTASPQTAPARMRQELILETHMHARTTHLTGSITPTRRNDSAWNRLDRVCRRRQFDWRE